MPKTLSVIGRRLGKRPQIVDPRTLRLQNYLAKLPPPPTEAGFWAKVSNWPMFLNDSIGDCVEAAAGHMIQQWTTYATVANVLIDNVILDAYEKITGYNPNDPSTDLGTAMLPALKWWRKVGYGGHKILAFATVNPQNFTEVCQAISLFGNVYIGVNLPLSAQEQTVWSVPKGGPVGDGSPGSWGGHCVPVVGYSNSSRTPGLKVVSWGQVYSMTWKFFGSYVDEVYAVLSPDWMRSDGTAPSGFPLAQLQADLKLIT